MKLISKSHKGFKILLSVIDIYSKYTWIISLKDKKDTIITNAFQKFYMNQMAKDSEFYNRLIKSWLEKLLFKCFQYIMKQNLF